MSDFVQATKWSDSMVSVLVATSRPSPAASSSSRSRRARHRGHGRGRGRRDAGRPGAGTRARRRVARTPPRRLERGADDRLHPRGSSPPPGWSSWPAPRTPSDRRRALKAGASAWRAGRPGPGRPRSPSGWHGVAACWRRPTSTAWRRPTRASRRQAGSVQQRVPRPRSNRASSEVLELLAAESPAGRGRVRAGAGAGDASRTWWPTRWPRCTATAAPRPSPTPSDAQLFDGPG